MSTNFTEQCAALLERRWDRVVRQQLPAPRRELDEEMRSAIRSCINSPTKTYRYVLPTQVLAKLANPKLDCRCIQLKRGGSGAFDARSLAHEVIVPFDRANHRVLGGAAEPYVSKPLRCEDVTPRWRADKRDKQGWDRLCTILDEVESKKNTEYTQAVFDCVLHAIFERLADVHIVYPVPRRISLSASIDSLSEFMRKRSGGLRYEAIIAALFETLGQRFGLFAQVRRTAVSAADEVSGSLADIECCDQSGEVIVAVEAKDRQITVRHLEDKLPMLRERGVTEAFFLSSFGTAAGDQEQIESLARSEFSAGHNIYVLSSEQFLPAVLSLLGEDGRRAFLMNVGHQLDEFAGLTDRQDWSQILRRL